MSVLVIDIGGTNVKILATGESESRRFPSGKELTPQAMVAGVVEAARGWNFDQVSVGYPGPVRHGRIIKDPHNLGEGWMGFDFDAAFGKRVRVINDAAMQALGSYEGGRMLFLGLGTGLGSALIVDRVLVSLELAHMPYRDGGTFEDFVGIRGLTRLGRDEWQKAVFDVIARLKAGLVADYVILGGGNVNNLDQLPPDCRRGSNDNAFLGGFRLWEGDYRVG
jgi:polyphosphate glucokinase